jgi:hypothetical protein
MRRILYLALLSVISLFATTTSLAESFAATGDTYTRSWDAATNFGSKKNVRVRPWAETTGFVKFDLGSLSGSVEEAYLRIPIRDVDTAGRVSVHRVWGGFNELTVTHNTRPGFTAAVASVNVTESDIGKTLSLNVTGLVQTLVERGTGAIAFTTANANVALGTREGGMPIRLDVETSGSGGSNRPPTISGSAPDAVANSNYSFVPQASDPDGDRLTFTIQNKPAWASFSSSNGQISGVPSEGSIGIHGDIRIVVSDGVASATLGPFDIDVADDGTGRVTLSWSIPTENTDGTPLTDLRSFRIDWTRAESSAQGSVTVNNPSISTYVIENLQPGTYTFTIYAINANGVASEPSNRVTYSVD